jgi:hypothetical protein
MSDTIIYRVSIQSAFISNEGLQELILNNNLFQHFSLCDTTKDKLKNGYVYLDASCKVDNGQQQMVVSYFENYMHGVTDGPSYRQAVHDADAIQEAGITSLDLPSLIRFWSGKEPHNNWHQIKADLSLTNFACFLARLWREAPLESSRMHPCIQPMVSCVIQALESEMGKHSSCLQGALDSEIFNRVRSLASIAVETCVDRVSLGLILMERNAAYALEKNGSEKSKIKKDLNFIDSIMSVVDKTSHRELFYDNNTRRLITLSDIVGSVDVAKLPSPFNVCSYRDYWNAAENSSDQMWIESDWICTQLAEINSRYNKNIVSIRITDDVEDILGIINTLIKSRDIKTIPEIPIIWQSHQSLELAHESAVINYIKKQVNSTRIVGLQGENKSPIQTARRGNKPSNKIHKASPVRPNFNRKSPGSSSSSEKELSKNNPNLFKMKGHRNNYNNNNSDSSFSVSSFQYLKG